MTIPDLTERSVQLLGSLGPDPHVTRVKQDDGTCPHVTLARPT